jgi:hypothetical protein
MKSLATNTALAIVSVASVLTLLVAHELLAAIAGDSDRFVMARRWLSRVFTALGVLLVVVIAARFYYLRAS